MSLGIVLVILVFDGSRTPVVISLASLVLFTLLSDKGKMTKTVITVSCLGVGVAATSLMIMFRSSGFSADNVTELHATYAQDDNYYRALWSFYYSDMSGEHWDALRFIYSIVTNPIPRAWWPEKPLLTAEFFGGFKDAWVTMSFLGEVVAMSGVFWAPVCIVAVGSMIYFALYKSASMLKYPFGTPVYLMMALYIYMTLRSLQNISECAYLVAFALAAAWLFRRMHKATRQYPSPSVPANAMRLRQS